MKFCTGHNLSSTLTIPEDDLHSSPAHWYQYILSINPAVNYTVCKWKPMICVVVICSVGSMQDKLKTKIVTSSEAYTFDGFTLVSRQQLHHVCMTTADLHSIVVSLFL